MKPPGSRSSTLKLKKDREFATAIPDNWMGIGSQHLGSLEELMIGSTGQDQLSVAQNPARRISDSPLLALYLPAQIEFPADPISRGGSVALL